MVWLLGDNLEFPFRYSYDRNAEKGLHQTDYEKGNIKEAVFVGMLGEVAVRAAGGGGLVNGEVYDRGRWCGDLPLRSGKVLEVKTTSHGEALLTGVVKFHIIVGSERCKSLPLHSPFYAFAAPLNWRELYAHRLSGRPYRGVVPVLLVGYASRRRVFDVRMRDGIQPGVNRVENIDMHVRDLVPFDLDDGGWLAEPTVSAGLTAVL